jgi:hypothetical protein
MKLTVFRHIRSPARGAVNERRTYRHVAERDELRAGFTEGAGVLGGRTVWVWPGGCAGARTAGSRCGRWLAATRGSKACKAAARRWRLHNREAVGIGIAFLWGVEDELVVRCPVCGTRFARGHGHRRDAVYCSHACRQAVYRARRRAERIREDVTRDGSLYPLRGPDQRERRGGDPGGPEVPRFTRRQTVTFAGLRSITARRGAVVRQVRPLFSYNPDRTCSAG